MESQQIFTIGHSTLSVSAFQAALKANGVTAVADVRSAPYSRFNSAFNRESLKRELRAQGTHYVFLGKELGGRPANPACYEDGRASYIKMAQTDQFKVGLERVIHGSALHRLALMCSEGEPLQCHRTLLIARALTERGIAVFHIDRSGQSVNQATLETRLIRVVGLSESLLRSREEVLSDAYALQAKRVAHTERRDAESGAEAAG
jgi:uncharacterized protein (DUF488 family)